KNYQEQISKIYRKDKKWVYFYKNEVFKNYHPVPKYSYTIPVNNFGSYTVNVKAFAIIKLLIKIFNIVGILYLLYYFLFKKHDNPPIDFINIAIIFTG